MSGDNVSVMIRDPYPRVYLNECKPMHPEKALDGYEKTVETSEWFLNTLSTVEKSISALHVGRRSYAIFSLLVF